MKKILVLLLFLIFTLPVFGKNTILILGDSLSASYGIGTQEGWVNLLRKKIKDEKLDYRVINSSASGDTTSNGLERLPSEIKRYQPSILIIELGGNDGLRGLQPSLIKRNLQAIITLGQQANSKILLLATRLPPNYGPVYINQFQKIYRELAVENNILLIPNFLKNVDEITALMQPDRLHPKQEAQQIILNNVWEGLSKLVNEN